MALELADAYKLHRLRDKQRQIEAQLDARQGFSLSHEEMRRMEDLRRAHEQSRGRPVWSGGPRGDQTASAPGAAKTPSVDGRT